MEQAAIRRIEVQPDRIQAIDLAVSLWERESSPRSQVVFSSRSPAAMSTTHLTVAKLIETAAPESPWHELETDHSQGRSVSVSRLTALMAISATAMTTREMLLSRAGLHLRRHPLAYTRSTASTKD
jgi:hypothetical protein